MLRSVNSISVFIADMKFEDLFIVFIIVLNYLIMYEPYHIFVRKK
jgi:hypothetical protein